MPPLVALLRAPPQCLGYQYENKNEGKSTWHGVPAIAWFEESKSGKLKKLKGRAALGFGVMQAATTVADDKFLLEHFGGNKACRAMTTPSHKGGLAWNAAEETQLCVPITLKGGAAAALRLVVPLLDGQKKDGRPEVARKIVDFFNTCSAAVSAKKAVAVIDDECTSLNDKIGEKEKEVEELQSFVKNYREKVADLQRITKWSTDRNTKLGIDVERLLQEVSNAASLSDYEGLRMSERYFQIKTLLEKTAISFVRARIFFPPAALSPAA